MTVAYYYDHMTKPKQAAYRSMLAGLTELTDSIQLPLLDAKELSEVFLLLRLDHPELFWASGFHFLHYQDSPNLIMKPEYLFDKSKVREHQKAMASRVAKNWHGLPKRFPSGRKKNTFMILSVRMSAMIN